MITHPSASLSSSSEVLRRELTCATISERAPRSNRPQFLLADGAFVAGLQRGLEATVGVEEASALLYDCGERWGREEMEQFVASTAGEGQGRAAPLGALLERWWRPLRAGGWGNWRVEVPGDGAGLVGIEVEGSVVASSLGPGGRPLCHVYAGLFAGVFGYLTGFDLACSESGCVSMGKGGCSFVVDHRARLEGSSERRGAGSATGALAVRSVLQ